MAAKKKQTSSPKGSKWKKLPKGWTAKSRKKFLESLVGDSEHPVTTCIEKMTGKVDDPGAFCASLVDRVLKRTTWRGKKKKASDKEFLSIKGPMRLPDVTDQLISRLTTGDGLAKGTVWVLDPNDQSGKNFFERQSVRTMDREIFYGLRAYADEKFDDADTSSFNKAKYSAMYDLINKELKIRIKGVVSKSGRKGWHIEIKPSVQEMNRMSEDEAKKRRERPDRSSPEDFLRRA